MAINIRAVKVDDYIDISKIRKMDGVKDNILSTSDEPAEKMKNKIMSITSNDFWFVAEDNCKVIGVSILNRHSNPRKKHVASITIMVDSNYHSKGIGTLLMKELINLSDNIIKLKRLELQVFADNKKAIKLYKKFGFVEEGVQKYSAIKNDIYTDELMMARIQK